MQQYQPLYLKYRPQKLSELVGQEVVKKTLLNAINYNKIVHAYLFCGPKGTGKTSTARILAKSLNCEKGITHDPCGKCVSCTSIVNGNSLDVIEIDAASRRKVEDVEDLINRVNLGTFGSRYKIYIIDEVHMLTDHAFNALLKTLEEPPNNVIFILATTEEYKVIPTVISRCQKHDFKPVSGSELIGRVKDISKTEKINIDDNVIDFISKRANGCLRDAISFLDQISVLQEDNKPIDSKEVFELFGTVDRASLFSLAEAVLSFDRKKAIDLTEDFIKSGKDISELFKCLGELFLDLAKAKLDSVFKKSLSVELKNDLNILNKINHGHLVKIIDRFNESQSRLRFALSQELQFLAEIITIMDEDFLISLSELKERIENLELKKEATKENVVIQPVDPPKEDVSVKENIENIEEVLLEKEEEPGLNSLWNKIVSLVDSNPTKTLLAQSESHLISAENDLLEVGISKDMFLPRLRDDAKRKEIILKAAKAATGKDFKVIKFAVVPGKKPVALTSIVQGNGQSSSNNGESPTPGSKQLKNTSENKDEISKTLSDLLGGKEIKLAD